MILVKSVLATWQKEIFSSIKSIFASRKDVIWLLLAMIIGVGIRGYFLSQPMRSDEASTFMNWVNNGFFSLFHYAVPNNHILHTLLVKASTLVWGVHPASIRLTALMAGIGLIPLTYCLCRLLNNSGIFASFTIAVFPYLISYSTNARGYSLLVLLTLALAFVVVQFTNKPSVQGVILISILASLGMLTIPTMLFQSLDCFSG